jgi:hypothetical protein
MSNPIDAPERIYLQVCDDSDCDEPFCEHHDVSWCQDKINNSDVEYVRADTAPPQRNEQEPVGWIYEDDEGRMMFSQMPESPPFWEPVYKAVPKQWQGLTDDEVLKEFWNIYPEKDVLFTDVERAFYRAIEAKLKEKNT